MAIKVTQNFPAQESNLELWVKERKMYFGFVAPYYWKLNLRGSNLPAPPKASIPLLLTVHNSGQRAAQATPRFLNTFLPLHQSPQCCIPRRARILASWCSGVQWLLSLPLLCLRPLEGYQASLTDPDIVCGLKWLFFSLLKEVAVHILSYSVSYIYTDK